MKRRLITVIVFAFIAALVSSTVLYRVISANGSRPAQPATVRVVVAAHDLESGALVSDADLKVVDWPGTVSPQWVGRGEDIAGRGLLTAIYAGEPFPENRLAPKGAGAGLSSRIPAGMRAVAVHLDESSGLARLVTPGMRVDVLSTGSGQANQNATRTILQNVEVLSTGQNVERGPQDKPTMAQSVNLLVSPPQAELLSQAIAQTRIQLVLRNPLDKGSMADTGEGGLKSLLQPVIASAVRRIAPGIRESVTPRVPQPPAPMVPAAASAEAKKPAPPVVEIIHGSKRAVTEVRAGQESGQ
jgi:pilus assembly protein CpaB